MEVRGTVWTCVCSYIILVGRPYLEVLYTEVNILSIFCANVGKCLLVPGLEIMAF